MWTSEVLTGSWCCLVCRMEAALNLALIIQKSKTQRNPKSLSKGLTPSRTWRKAASPVTCYVFSIKDSCRVRATSVLVICRTKETQSVFMEILSRSSYPKLSCVFSVWGLAFLGQEAISTQVKAAIGFTLSLPRWRFWGWVSPGDRAPSWHWCPCWSGFLLVTSQTLNQEQQTWSEATKDAFSLCHSISLWT